MRREFILAKNDWEHNVRPMFDLKYSHVQRQEETVQKLSNAFQKFNPPTISQQQAERSYRKNWETRKELSALYDKLDAAKRPPTTGRKRVLLLWVRRTVLGR